MSEWLYSFHFLHFAFFSSVIMALACGSIGSFLVLKKQSFLSDTIAHASLLGIAIGLFIGVQAETVLIPFAAVLALFLTWMSLDSQEDTVTISAVLFSVCAGIGILLLTIKGKGGQELVHVLLGDLLWIGAKETALLFGVAVFTMSTLYLVRRELTLVIFNREIALASGVSPKRYEYLFAVCVALLIAVSIKLVGVFLVTSLVSVPPLMAARLARSFRSQVVLCTGVSVVFMCLGFSLAVFLDLPFGPTIAALLGVGYVLLIALVPGR